MPAVRPSIGQPRLGFALLVSLFFHAIILLPLGDLLRIRQAVPDVAPLMVRLPPPESAPESARVLATQPEPEPLPAAALPPPPPATVSPAPTLVKARPKPLTGRALDTAMAAIVSEEFYPREAIERGIEGRVVLLLTLTETGGVADIEMASSSGHALLDTAALAAARRITTLPAGRRQVLLPVEFRLE